MSFTDLNVVLPALITGRLWLAYSSLPAYLRDHQLLSSPLTAYSRLQEGLFLAQRGIDPYAGGPFHHSPLYLSLFGTLLPSSGWAAPLLWTAADTASAYALVRIWRARQGVAKSSRDALVAAAYLLNPYIFMSTLSQATSSFDNLSVILALMFATEGRASASLFATAFATHLSLPAGLLLPPVVLLLLASPSSTLASPRFHPLTTNFNKLQGTLAAHLGTYVLYLGALALVACAAAGDFSFGWVKQTWRFGLLLTDLSPNVGLWWYLFTEMFDHFRPFFLSMFSLHLCIYVAPICIKFQHDPLYAAFVLLGVIGMFKPYPTLADPGLFLSLIALFPETYPHLRHPLPTALLHLHAAALLPLFHALWLRTGTGNANFFYASTLVFGLANAGAVLDAIWAGLRIAVGKGFEGRDIEVVQE